MGRHVVAGVVAITVVAGCASSYIYNPDVIGPHGEHLIELACTVPDQCMSLARRTCGGDFDLVTGGSAVGGDGTAVSSVNLMLVQCRRAQIDPAAPQVLDGG
jgi:hypothetical protein